MIPLMHLHLKNIFILYWSIVDWQCVSFRLQQSDSVTHKQVSILFKILFPFRLLQNVEQKSLWYTIGPCLLSVFLIKIAVRTCQSETASSLPPGNHEFSKFVSL